MNPLTDILGDTREGLEYPSGNDAIRAAKLQYLLSTVAHGLAPVSVAFVRCELAEHYRMAYRRHRASGAADMVAHDRAIADLGSPRVLRRKYRATMMGMGGHAITSSFESGTIRAFETTHSKLQFFSVLVMLLLGAGANVLSIWLPVYVPGAYLYARLVVRAPQWAYARDWKRLAIWLHIVPLYSIGCVFGLCAIFAVNLVVPRQAEGTLQNFLATVPIIIAFAASKAYSITRTMSRTAS
jgi:hypothetical protein